MLVLSRKNSERIVIGDDIVIEIVRIKGNRVTLGLVAPANVSIKRSELIDRPERNKSSSAKPNGSGLLEKALLVAG